jgi:hypothetical protein
MVHLQLLAISIQQFLQGLVSLFLAEKGKKAKYLEIFMR